MFAVLLKYNTIVLEYTALPGRVWASVTMWKSVQNRLIHSDYQNHSLKKRQYANDTDLCS